MGSTGRSGPARCRRKFLKFFPGARPNWQTYRSLLDFARRVRADTQELGPRDMMDIQSFMWVQGSSEYD
jgi:hypothetical protein